MARTFTDQTIRNIYNADIDTQVKIFDALDKTNLSKEDYSIYKALKKRILPDPPKKGAKELLEVAGGKGVVKHLLSGVIGASNEEKARAAAKHSDKFFYPTEKNGRWGVYHQKDDGTREFVYINKKGASWQDLATIGTEAAMFIPAFRGARVASKATKAGSKLLGKGKNTVSSKIKDMRLNSRLNKVDKESPGFKDEYKRIMKLQEDNLKGPTGPLGKAAKEAKKADDEPFDFAKASREHDKTELGKNQIKRQKLREKHYRGEKLTDAEKEFMNDVDDKALKASQAARAAKAAEKADDLPLPRSQGRVLSEKAQRELDKVQGLAEGAKPPGLLRTALNAAKQLPLGINSKAGLSFGIGAGLVDYGRQEASQALDFRDDIDYGRVLGTGLGSTIGAMPGTYMAKSGVSLPYSKVFNKIGIGVASKASIRGKEISRRLNIPLSRAEVYARATKKDGSPLELDDIRKLEAQLAVNTNNIKESITNLGRQAWHAPSAGQQRTQYKTDTRIPGQELWGAFGNLYNSLTRSPRLMNRMNMNQAGYDMLTGHSAGKIIGRPSVQELSGATGGGLMKLIMSDD